MGRMTRAHPPSESLPSPSPRCGTIGAIHILDKAQPRAAVIDLHMGRDPDICLVTTLYPPNACNKVAFDGDDRLDELGVELPGGLNVLMGDGSVRFIKDSIQS